MFLRGCLFKGMFLGRVFLRCYFTEGGACLTEWFSRGRFCKVCVLRGACLRGCFFKGVFVKEVFFKGAFFKGVLFKGVLVKGGILFFKMSF